MRPIAHEDRLSVVDHLDELRSRLIICAVAFIAAWALTGWQNHLVLEIVNKPLPDGIEPITLGPAEAFYTTLTNAAYAALLLALPVILYQLYAFLLPAFSPGERRVATFEAEAGLRACRSWVRRSHVEPDVVARGLDLASERCQVDFQLTHLERAPQCLFDGVAANDALVETLHSKVGDVVLDGDLAIWIVQACRLGDRLGDVTGPNYRAYVRSGRHEVSFGLR